MKTIYIADDGTQFENKYDCETYERIQYETGYNNSTNFMLFDDEGKRFTENVTDKMDYAYYVYIKNVFNDPYLYDLLKMNDYPIEDGLYYYDDNYEKWTLLDKVISNLETQLKLHLSIKEKIEGYIK